MFVSSWDRGVAGCLIKYQYLFPCVGYYKADPNCLSNLSSSNDSGGGEKN